MAQVMNIKIDQGSTYFKSMEMKKADLTPYDLTNITFRGQVRKSINAVDIAATLVFTKTETPTDGVVSIEITATETAALKSTVKYVYDIEMVNGTFVTRILQGSITVNPEVTR